MGNQKLIRDFYKMLLVSQTGKGKTYSFRNMDRARTGFINAENKPLPFDGGPFKYHAKPKKFAGVMKAIIDYGNNPEIDVIVLDSLSEVFDLLVNEMRANFSGYDIWSNYNKQIGELLTLIKGIEKEMFITCHYEILNMEGEAEKRVKVKGKEWEGLVEKAFTVVLYAQEKWTNEKPDYFFKLAGEGMSTKCPPAIFGEGVYKIPNDSQVVLEKVVDFAKRSATVKETTETEIFN